MFLLFAGDNYYPEGGWHDFQGAFASIEDAEEYFRHFRTQECRFDWGHIVAGTQIVKVL